ncbi:MAG: sugar phosphate isomerase/epimerase [Methanotrichaceae archaeon]|nr:sugar phosphate isomerase/epimerase [Methanotrichaceae archaeon]
MNIGISTWAYQDQPLNEALRRISELSSHAEILCEAGHSLLDRENRDAAESFDLNYTVHGLVTDVNIASIYPGLRRESVALHRQAIEASVSIGAGLYVIHPGFTSWGHYRSQALEALKTSIAELSLMQEELGIRLAVENMPRSDWLFFHRPDLDLQGMGLVLDVGHAHTCGTLPEFLNCEELAHVHLHDNSGKSDDHLPLGQGGIDFSPVLEAIGKMDISAVLEHKTEDALHESLQALQQMV